MKAIFFSVAAACALSLFTLSVAAQDTDNANFVPAQITVTPQVTPPKESVESGLGGSVRVMISIDGSGLVTGVDAVTGPGSVCRQVTREDVVAMRNAAKEAALTARFNPATDKGRPVPSSTWLTFTFPGEASMPEPKGSRLTPDAGSENNTVVGSADRETALLRQKANAKNEPHAQTAPPQTVYKEPAGAAPETAAAPAIPKMIRGGIINGKAVSLPKPAYPSQAKAVNASGAVSVQVLIDHDGSVFAANAFSGHPLLRDASAIAACDARFSPTQLSGQPVKVVGVITYNFIP